jgi:AcrR family transcriptional regulator
MVSDTRRRILVTAAKLFAENGYEGVRTKEIAKASKISEVTLFKYFPKKRFCIIPCLTNFSIR